VTHGIGVSYAEESLAGLTYNDGPAWHNKRVAAGRVVKHQEHQKNI